MYKRYYVLAMTTTGSGRIDKEFATYAEALDYMCELYVREKQQGYTPTQYKILRYDISKINGTENTMVQPTWTE